VGSNPTPSAILNVFVFNRMAKPEEASASESASEIITGLPPVNYGFITGQPLEMTGFAARLV
jgi:ABC-type phosphate transport system permease subunit